MSLSQSTLTSFLKRSAPETHDADDGTSNVVHSKKKKSEDNKKKYETKRIRKFQPTWQKDRGTQRQFSENKKTPEGAYAGCVGLRKNFGYVGWQLSRVCNKCVQEKRRCSVKD